MKKLVKLLDQLESYVLLSTTINTSVSEASIGWHIEHACLVIIKITETIQQSNPADYASRFNIKKMVVFLTGKFPRGRAKAPNSVLPKDAINQDHLNECIAQARQSIINLNQCRKNQFFLHPIFGNLNTRQTFHFLGIHTMHHIRIVQDILK